MGGAHPNQKLTPEEPIPRLFRVVLMVLVDQQQPLITTDRYFATWKLPLHPDSILVSHVEWEEHIRNSTSCPPNSNQWGREAVLLQDGGSHDSSWHFVRGADSMPNLSLLSNPTPRLLDSWYHRTVHWICPSESLKNERMVQNHEWQKHTSSAISMTHSSDSRRRSRKWGTIWQSLSKTWHPLLALCLRGIWAQRWLRQEQQGYTPK